MTNSNEDQVPVREALEDNLEATLKGIENEEVPERLLELARELQAQLRLRSDFGA